MRPAGTAANKAVVGDKSLLLFGEVLLCNCGVKL